MKVLRVIAKVVLALAAIAGIVYLAATYGDRIVAWCKKILHSKFGCDCICDCDCDCDCEDDGECACGCCCEEAEEAVEAPAATEADFEG